MRMEAEKRMLYGRMYVYADFGHIVFLYAVVAAGVVCNVCLYLGVGV